MNFLQLRNLENFYVFNKRNLSRRKREAKYLTKSLIEKPNVSSEERTRKFIFFLKVFY